MFSHDAAHTYIYFRLYIPFLWGGVFFVVFCLTSRSTIFQPCWDGATASCVFTSTLGSLKCLAQGHYTAVMGFEPWTSRPGVRRSTTEPPRPILFIVCIFEYGNNQRHRAPHTLNSGFLTQHDNMSVSFITPSTPLLHRKRVYIFSYFCFKT